VAGKWQVYGRFMAGVKLYIMLVNSLITNYISLYSYFYGRFRSSMKICKKKKKYIKTYKAVILYFASAIPATNIFVIFAIIKLNQIQYATIRIYSQDFNF